MKTCLLNLPCHTRIIRRYNCSYRVSNFLYPPLELMYLGAIIKEWKKDSCILIDAIAERLSLNKIITRLKKYQPDSLVFMAGIESFTEDMQTIMAIKSHFPALKIICIGYLPSIFPKEILEVNRAIDYIVMNEPEISFSELYDEIKADKLTEVPITGIAKRYNGRLIIGQERPRIKDLDILPFPDRSLIQQQLYNEFLLRRPFTTILTIRGCPFRCTFCIPTYGNETVFRSVENVLGEIEEVVLKYKVKAIRFLDDTFTLNKDRIRQLCALILERNLKFQWTALSRVGLLDMETVCLMKKAGLARIYLGIETASQRLLDYYQKDYNVNLIEEQVKIIKENNIEAAGLFIVGGIETREELKRDIALAKRLNLDYINVSEITPYPGTKFFEDMKDSIVSNLFPYLITFKDGRLQREGIKLAKSFFYNFYFRSRYVIKMLRFLFLYPQDLIRGVKRVFRFVFFYCNSRKGGPRFI